MLKRACLAGVVLSLALGLACGDRTGLVVDDTYGGDDASPRDAGRDAFSDVHHDGLPMIDVAIRPDVDKRDCPDADATLIYLITTDYVLYSFYPPTADFKQIGKIACPSTSGATPFSMAVDRKGIAKIVFTDGTLYRVSTSTAACQGTTFQPSQSGFFRFGMGYASDTNGPNETLYVAGDNNSSSATGLASIDASYVLHPIGQFVPTIKQAELTGTGSGDLYAFYSDKNTDPDSFIGQVDKQSGRIVGETRMTDVSQGDGWAFAFWGGDFYLFTSPTRTMLSEVTRFRPSDGTITPLTSLRQVIVGAGVSTCAPQN